MEMGLSYEKVDRENDEVFIDQWTYANSPDPTVELLRNEVQHYDDAAEVRHSF